MPARPDDQSYFSERARQCRAQAERADDPAVRHLHLDFAAAYDRRARAEAGRPSAVLPAQ